jgi:hypothetical protein
MAIDGVGEAEYEAADNEGGRGGGKGGGLDDIEMAALILLLLSFFGVTGGAKGSVGFFTVRESQTPLSLLSSLLLTSEVNDKVPIVWGS